MQQTLTYFIVALLELAGPLLIILFCYKLEQKNKKPDKKKDQTFTKELQDNDLQTSVL